MILLLAEVRGRGAGEAEATEGNTYPDRVRTSQLKSIDRSPGVRSSRRDRLASLLTGEPNQVARPGEDAHDAQVLAGERIHRGRQEQAAPGADEAALDTLLYRIGLVEYLRLDRWGRHLVWCGGGIGGDPSEETKEKAEMGRACNWGKSDWTGPHSRSVARAWCCLEGHVTVHVT